MYQYITKGMNRKSMIKIYYRDRTISKQFKGKEQKYQYSILRGGIEEVKVQYRRTSNSKQFKGKEQKYQYSKVREEIEKA